MGKVTCSIAKYAVLYCCLVISACVSVPKDGVKPLYVYNYGTNCLTDYRGQFNWVKVIIRDSVSKADQEVMIDIWDLYACIGDQYKLGLITSDNFRQLVPEYNRFIDDLCSDPLTMDREKCWATVDARRHLRAPATHYQDKYVIKQKMSLVDLSVTSIDELLERYFVREYDHYRLLGKYDSLRDNPSFMAFLVENRFQVKWAGGYPYMFIYRWE
jgi:hypothetical protein